MRRGNFGGKRSPIVKYKDFLPELCRNDLTDRFAVGFVGSIGPKKAQVQSYSQGGAIVHNFNRLRQVAPYVRTDSTAL